jgi:hypothetical protein
MTDEPNYPPTIDEMRRVARYLAQEMNMPGAAGKLLAKCALLERVVDELMKEKRDG